MLRSEMRGSRSGAAVHAAVALACGGLLLLAPASRAATITPDTLTDDNVNNGNCTLREAIISANADAADDACTGGSGADTINLSAGPYELSVGPAGDDAAANGDLDITDPDGLKITGDAAGSTVDANAIDRVFNTRAAATATFDRLTLTGGSVTGDMGGAIDVDEGSTANIIDTTLTGNTATGEAGAIEVHTASTLNLRRSTLARNSSTTQEGGGLEYDSNNTTVNVTNTTFSGNTAAVAGGAIETEGGVGNFRYVTITNNSAPSAGGIVLTQADGAVSLKGTILAGNTATTGPECTTPTATPVTSQGHNLIGTTSGCTFASQGTDITGQGAQLGPLADNGGPTQTHALGASSPAIDAADPTDFPAADQRGIRRPQGPRPDIGAYELVPPPPPPPSNEFSFGKVRKNKRKGTAKLTVNVPGPGELELAKTKKVRADEEAAEAAGKEKLSVKPKGKAKKKLNKKGKAKVKANVTFTPTGGTSNAESKRIKLVKR
jgi:CSLREA domain-containing protein